MTDKPYYQHLFSSLPFPALALKPEENFFRVLQANKPFLEMTGQREKEVVGKIIREPLPENPHCRDVGFYISLASLQQSYLSGTKQTVEFSRNIDGQDNIRARCFSVTSIPVPNDRDEIEVIFHILQDITQVYSLRRENEQLQEEVVRYQQQLTHFVDHNPDGLYSLDHSGKFTSANEGLLKLAEVTKEELLQMNFLPFCADQKEVQSYFQRALAGESLTFESNFVSVKRKEMILKISLVPYRVENEITGVYGIAKDVTTVRESEKLVLEKRRFLEVNASFIKSLLDHDLEDKALKEAFAIVGKTVSADRMYYFGADRDPVSGEIFISQKIEWTSSNATPQIENPEMQHMPSSRVKEIMGPLQKNLPFTGRLSGLQEGSLKDLFIDQEIKSMLLLPVFLKNELYGFLGFDDCTRERVWSQDEVDFLQSLSHYFTNALEKKSAEKIVLQKEEEIRKSEKKFKALVQEGSDLISIIDKAGNFLFVSNTVTPALGGAPEKFIGLNAFNFVHPDDVDRIKRDFHDLEQRKQKRTQPYRFKNQAGEWRWIETAATNLLNDPAVGGIVLNSRDVTTIIEQAKEIEQINERYRLAAAATNDLIYDWDLENDQIIRFHKGEKDLFGYKEQEIDEKTFWQNNVHPLERQRENSKLQGALADKNQNTIKTEYRFRRADGSYAKVTDRGYILRSEEGKAIRIIGAVSDISDITSKEEALRLANKRFKMAMKATNEVIWDWDIEQDHVTRSEAFEKAYGYKREKSNSVKAFWLQKVVLKDRQRVKESLYAALNNKQQKMWRDEYGLEKSDGEHAHIIDRGYIVRDKEGNATRVVGAILDVTESRRLIKKIKKQNEGLKEIAWKQSHEVRAPLARLMGLLHLLQTVDSNDLDKKELLDHIFCSANELDKIVREIVTKTEIIAITPEEEDSPSPDPVTPRLS